LRITINQTYHRAAGTLIALLAIMTTGCKQEVAPPPPAPPPEVGVRVVEVQSLKVVERFQGLTQAVNEIDLKAEVSGPITAIHFHEGQALKAGDILFEIDPLPFQAELEHQLQLLESARIQVGIANTRFSMAKKMESSGGMSRLDIESTRVDLATARADEASAVATLAKASLNLERATIRAPRDGIVGLTGAEIGEFVTPLSGKLVTLSVDNSIEVVLNINEDKYLAFMARKRANPDLQADVLTLELADGSIYPHTGLLNFVSREISQATGTVKHRVVFPNPDGVLLAGQRLTVLATEIDPNKMIVIPQTSVQEDQVGRYVYVVDTDSLAQKRYLTMGERRGIDWVVEKGLEAGDSFIVSGILRAKAGQPVIAVAE